MLQIEMHYFFISGILQLNSTDIEDVNWDYLLQTVPEGLLKIVGQNIQIIPGNKEQFLDLLLKNV